MANDVKSNKFVRQMCKITAVRAGVLAHWVQGENPGPQQLLKYSKGDELEVSVETAEALIRGKRAEFLDPKMAKAFKESESLRLEEAAETGNFLNDVERREYYKSVDSLVQVPVSVK